MKLVLRNRLFPWLQLFCTDYFLSHAVTLKRLLSMLLINRLKQSSLVLREVHSGDLASYGVPSVKAAELVVWDINAKGGILFL